VDENKGILSGLEPPVHAVITPEHCHQNDNHNLFCFLS